MHVPWLQVMNQWLGIFCNEVQVKPCLETLHIILGVTQYLKHIDPLQRKAMKRCTVRAGESYALKIMY